MSKVQSMRRFKWMLLAMALLLWPVLVSLGFWQLDRAEQKSELLESWEVRAQQTQSLASSDLVRFSSVESQGEFDRERWLLLDNRTREGKVGYEVVAPVLSTGHGNTSLGQSRLDTGESGSSDLS